MPPGAHRFATVRFGSSAAGAGRFRPSPTARRRSQPNLNCLRKLLAYVSTYILMMCDDGGLVKTCGSTTPPTGASPLREHVDAQRLYAVLAHTQRGRYNALLEVGNDTPASANPELFFESALPLRVDHRGAEARTIRRPSSRVGSVAPSLSRTCSPTSRRSRGAGRRDALTHRSPSPRACRCR